MKGIISSDKLFTIRGVVFITIAGFSAAIYGGIPILKTGWIFWSLVLFILSGLIFSWKLAPLQRKIYQLIKKADANNFNQVLYHSYLMQWERWGLAAMLTPLVALILMVMKIPVYSIFLKDKKFFRNMNSPKIKALWKKGFFSIGLYCIKEFCDVI